MNNMQPAIVDRGVKRAYRYVFGRSRSKDKAHARRVVRRVERIGLRVMGENYQPLRAHVHTGHDVI